MERATGTMNNTLSDYAGNHMWIMDHHIYSEVRIAHLTSVNLALHDLSYGKATWIVRSNYSHFTPLLIVTELVNRMYVMRRRLASTLRVPL